MIVAEAEVIIQGDDRGAQKAFDRTKVGMGKLAKDGRQILGDGAKGWGDAVLQGMGQSSRKAGDAVGQVKRSVVDMAQTTARSMKTVGDSGEDAAKRLRSVEGSLRSVEAMAHKAGVGMAAGLTAPLLAAAKLGIGYAGDFQESMSVFRVTANATAADMAKVGAAAIQLGNDEKLPGTSALDAAHAMLELSKAGLTVKDTLGAARGVLQLSAAGQIGNAEAAKIAANALNGFGLAGTKAAMVSDLLAAAANKSGASMTEIADGLAQSAAVYHAAGISIADLTTGLSMLRKAGIAGSDAGTSMKTMLIALEKPTTEAATQLKKWGVNVYDAQGKMNSFKVIIAQFEVATKGLTQKQRDFGLATVFGSDAVRAANVIVGGGVEKFNALEKAVTRHGVAAEIAAAHTEGFNGKLEAMKSAGQTMLQAYLTPVLPKLTEYAEGVTKGFDAMGKWSPATKRMALDAAGVAIVAGPALIFLGKVSGGVRAIIGLRAAFVAAQAAKAAALVATGGAATTAATAETAEGAATEWMTLQARLAAPALASEAVALDGLAASAGAAALKVGGLRGAIALLGGMALPAVMGVGSAAGVAYMAKDFEGSVKDAKDANAKVYRAYQSKAYGAARNVLGKLGKVGLMEQAGKPGSGYTAQDAQDVMRNQKRDRAADWLANNARRLPNAAIGRYGERIVPLTPDGDAIKGALAAMNPDPHAGERPPKSPRGGGGAGRPRRTDEDRAEAKATRDNASAVAALRDQYYEADKAVRLYGKSQASVSLQYDIDHGKIARQNVAQAEGVVRRLRDVEAAEKGTQARERAMAAEADWDAARIEHAKAMAATKAVLSDRDRASYALFGKAFAQVVDAHSRQRVMWAAEEAHAARMVETRAAWAAVRDRIAEARVETRDRNAERVTATALAWSAVRDRIAEVRAEMVKAADARFTDVFAELNERLTMAGTESERTRARLVKMAEAFGIGTTAAERIRTGMGRANEAMRLTLKVDRIEAFRSRMREVAAQVGGYFGKMSTDVLSGMRLTFGGIVGGFGAMMADIARQQLAGSIQHGLTGLLAGALGGGGKQRSPASTMLTAFGGFHATGGPVLSHEAVVVGERGPELFVPSGSGSVETAARTRKAVGGRAIQVTVNVSAPNPGAFHDSTPQTMQRVGHAVRAALGSLG